MEKLQSEAEQLSQTHPERKEEVRRGEGLVGYKDEGTGGN